jgi:hypothetical protein
MSFGGCPTEGKMAEIPEDIEKGTPFPESLRHRVGEPAKKNIAALAEYE